MTDPDQVSDAERAAKLHNALVVEELVAANSESNKTMLSLVERVREETAARDRKVDALERSHQQMRWVIGLGIVVVVILIVVGVFNAVNLNTTRKNQQQEKSIAAAVQATNQTLLDCVNSQGSCGRANAAEQAQILNTVKLYELTVVYCARTNPQPIDPKGNKFLACVTTLYPDGPKLDRKGQ